MYLIDINRKIVIFSQYINVWCTTLIKRYRSFLYNHIQSMGLPKKGQKPPHDRNRWYCVKIYIKLSLFNGILWTQFILYGLCLCLVNWINGKRFIYQMGNFLYSGSIYLRKYRKDEIIRLQFYIQLYLYLFDDKVRVSLKAHSFCFWLSRVLLMTFYI